MHVFRTINTISLVSLISLFHISIAGQIGRNASGNKGVVVAGKSQAVDAGIRILENGGNAADAATASLLMLAVKAVGAFCMGGEVPVIIHDAATHQVKVLSGQGAQSCTYRLVDLLHVRAPRALLQVFRHARDVFEADL